MIQRALKTSINGYHLMQGFTLFRSCSIQHQGYTLFHRGYRSMQNQGYSFFGSGYSLRTGSIGSYNNLLLVRNYKVKTSLQKRCDGCQFTVRKGKLRVVCSQNPRHKQRQK